MNVSVWDTYVKRKDGKLMHFDILVPFEVQDEHQIFEYGSAYLSTKAFKTSSITTKECKFCHIETAPEHVVIDINDKGYSIIEMENCN